MLSILENHINPQTSLNNVLHIHLWSLTLQLLLPFGNGLPSGPVSLLRYMPSVSFVDGDNKDAKKAKNVPARAGLGRGERATAVPPRDYPNSLIQISGLQTCLHMGMT